MYEVTKGLVHNFSLSILFCIYIRTYLFTLIDTCQLIYP